MTLEIDTDDVAIAITSFFISMILTLISMYIGINYL